MLMVFLCCTISPQDSILINLLYIYKKSMGAIEYHHIEALDCPVQVIDNSPCPMWYIKIYITTRKHEHPCSIIPVQ